MALGFGQLSLLPEKRGQLRHALEWAVRCAALLTQFPNPATGPEHLARLAAQLGLAL